jgi:AraC-like DNA-binding protein
LHELVIARRVDRVRLLLAETDLPLRAIAAEVGYASEFYLSRQFRERTGMSPREFRAQQDSDGEDATS